jgi:hypothetical protein
VFERKKETESHFREKKYELYYDLLKLLYDLTQSEGNSENTIRQLTEWQRNLILFAGPKTIHHFVLWMNNLKAGNLTLRMVLLMENFYRSLRSDLGISNFGLAEGDLAHLVLRHGDLFLKMAKKILICCSLIWPKWRKTLKRKWWRVLRRQLRLKA